MNGASLLRQTATLIERGWCCGAEARDGAGAAVEAADPAAVSWSLLGALVLVSDRPDASLTALRDALWGISGVITDSSLDDWNDRVGRTQTDTLDMLARAGASLQRHPAPSVWPE